MAKGIASGLPLSGILATPRAHGRGWRPGSHGGTYGGNVVSCAAALATLDVIEDEGLVANARERGAQLLAGLRGLATSHPSIGDVRGLGLMVALELVQPGEGDGRVPIPPLTKRVQAACFARLLVLTAGTYVNVDPDHPAARDDGRGGRPRAGGARRIAGRRRRLGARPRVKARGAVGGRAA